MRATVIILVVGNEHDKFPEFQLKKRAVRFATRSRVGHHRIEKCLG